MIYLKDFLIIEIIVSETAAFLRILSCALNVLRSAVKVLYVSVHCILSLIDVLNNGIVNVKR